MKDVIPKDTRYVPLTQQAYHCVPTCIQMIMLRHNIPLIPAELIGYYFDIIVSKEDKKLFHNIKSGPKPQAGYGTQINEKTASNKLFKEMRIPLKMRFNLIDKFNNLEEFTRYLRTRHNKDFDIIVCFEYAALFKSNAKGGHTCVLDKIYLKEGKVRIIDPGRNSPKWREVSIPKLYHAMKVHGKEKTAGFWQLSLTKLK